MPPSSINDHIYHFFLSSLQTQNSSNEALSFLLCFCSILPHWLILLSIHNFVQFFPLPVPFIFTGCSSFIPAISHIHFFKCGNHLQSKVTDKLLQLHTFSLFLYFMATWMQAFGFLIAAVSFVFYSTSTISCGNNVFEVLASIQLQKNILLLQ